MEHRPFWDDLEVVVAHDPYLLEYPPPGDAPFDPQLSYPEYAGPIVDRSNGVYSAVRDFLRLSVVTNPTSAHHSGTRCEESSIRVCGSP